MARTRRTPGDAGEKIAARRRFLKVIPAAVAAGIAAPALAQQEPPRIARETLDCAEKIFGVDFTEAEEEQAASVVNQNLASFERLRELNIPAVSGDASDPGVLIQAHVHRASVLAVAAPDVLQVRRMVEVARTLNPKIEILLRAHSDEEAALLERERLGAVFMGEQQLAVAMARHILARCETR